MTYGFISYLLKNNNYITQSEENLEQHGKSSLNPNFWNKLWIFNRLIRLGYIFFLSFYSI